MMKQLRGRNLAHPGCLIGVTTGLIVGIVVAGILAASFNIAFNIDAGVWLALTVGLGAIGWIIGAAMTTKYATTDPDARNDSSSDTPA